MPDRLNDSPKVIVTTGQIVPAVEGIRVFRSQNTLPDPQGHFVKPNGILYAPQVKKPNSHAVATLEGIWMLRAQFSYPDVQDFRQVN